MKYRVMGYNGIIEDFDTEAEAMVAFALAKKLVARAKVTDISRPSCNIHRCYNDEEPSRSCEIIEEYIKP